MLGTQIERNSAHVHDTLGICSTLNPPLLLSNKLLAGAALHAHVYGGRCKEPYFKSGADGFVNETLCYEN